jgi:cysteine-rich repeat protein
VDVESSSEPPSATGTPPPADVPPCGNGTLDEDEECDDGNARDGDGCDADCTWSCHGDDECPPADVCGEYHCSGDEHVCIFTGISCEDGDPCTYDSCAPGRGCVSEAMLRWYRDADEDCYGDADDSICSGRRRPGEGVHAPLGYVENRNDCCDLDFDVKPRVYWEWFEEPHDCGGTWAPSFDYDCDGVEERKWPDPGYCDTGTGSGCWVVEGWMEPVPSCGAEGSWLTGCWVDPAEGGCVPFTMDARVQPCK